MILKLAEGGFYLLIYVKDCLSSFDSVIELRAAQCSIRRNGEDGKLESI